jgi:hypothetical protein
MIPKASRQEPRTLTAQRLGRVAAAIMLLSFPLRATGQDSTGNDGAAEVFPLPYFLGNGETGIYLSCSRGGKNLRLTYADRMQGPYDPQLSEPIVGQGTSIVNRMGEGPSLIRRDGLWWLYWDAPGSRYSYCLATSPDLVTWTNRSREMTLPAEHMRHGTVLVVPEDAVGFLE